MANTGKTDRTGKQIVEVSTGNGGHLRITKVPAGWTGGETLRFQIREVNGRVWRGPEIPITAGPDVVRGIAELLMP